MHSSWCVAVFGGSTSVIVGYIDHYNTVRLHSSIEYVPPETKLNGLEKQVFKDRDAKLEATRAFRKEKRQQQHGCQHVANEIFFTRLGPMGTPFCSVALQNQSRLLNLKV